MAYINFEVSTITAAGTTEGTGLGALSFYGTKFGQGPGFWLRIPLIAEPIGDCCTTTPQILDSWGLYYWVGTTTPTLDSGPTAVGTDVVYYGGPLKVYNFEKGGRWLFLGLPAGLDAGGTVGAGLDGATGSGAFLKRMEFYYRSTRECGKPPALSV